MFILNMLKKDSIKKNTKSFCVNKVYIWMETYSQSLNIVILGLAKKVTFIWFQQERLQVEENHVMWNPTSEAVKASAGHTVQCWHKPPSPYSFCLYSSSAAESRLSQTNNRELSNDDNMGCCQLL